MLFGFVDRTSTDKPSAAELLGRQDVQQMLDAVDKICAYTSPTSALVLAQSGAASLAEAVADTALITAAGALWSALASSAYPGALA